MPNRAVAWETESNRGHGVWELLCRAALRGVDAAARVFGLEASEGRVERAELIIGFGVTPPPGCAPLFDVERAIDWARLSEFDRGRVAREMKALQG